jgi:hypothetical protein
MSLTYITMCDVCGARFEGWPEGDNDLGGWMKVSNISPAYIETGIEHLCSDCWLKAADFLKQ